MIWHPVLFSIYPVLFVAHFNQGQAEWIMVLLMLLVALLVTGVLACGAWLGLRLSADMSIAKRVALTVSIWVVLFYFYGPLVSGLEHLKWTLAKNGHKWARHVYESIHWILTPLWVVLGGLSLKWARRLSGAKLEMWTQVLNRVSVVLVVMVGIQLVTAAFQDAGGETSGQ